jgi:DNA-binding protein WhiA
VSLSEEVRSELAAIAPRKPCCRLAELSALLRTAGSIHLRGGGRVALHLDVSTPAVARRTFSLLRGFGVTSEIRTFRRQAFDRARRFQFHLEDDARAAEVLNEAGVVDARLTPIEAPPRRIVDRSCCRAAYLRGAMLAAGSVSAPRHAHLELRTATREGADFLAALARADGFQLAVKERRGHALAYSKAADTIADFLAFLGAHDAALRLGESAVIGATRARANRLANADHANLARVSRAADEQLRAIRRLEQQGRLEHLGQDLRELAELRRRHPTLSMRELAHRCAPPATKAAVQRRLAKLRQVAER